MDPLLLPVVQMPNFQRNIYGTLYQLQRGMRRHMQSTITPQADIVSPPSDETTLRRYSISQMAEQTALRYATSTALLLGIIVVGANFQRNPVPMFDRPLGNWGTHLVAADEPFPYPDLPLPD